MAYFKIKTDQQTSQLADLPKGPLKDQFESLKTSIDNQLGTLRCETHNVEPTIFLENDGDHVKVSGLGTCCRQFSSKTTELVKSAGIDTKDWRQVTVRKEMIF